MGSSALDGPDVRGDADIRLVGVVKRYSGRRVLDEVSLEIAGGTVHALVGANGAGKSTLGQILAGVTRLDAGELYLGERRVRWREPRDARREGIALIAQELAVVPQLTVMQNVFLGIEPRRGVLLARRQMERRYDELVERWAFQLERNALVGRLRLADQQKVEILRAVASGARIIVMDEPTSSLTHIETELLHQMIRKLRSSGATIVYISHFLDSVLEVADTVSVLRNGRLVDSAPVAATSEAGLVRAMFGETAEAEIGHHVKPALRAGPTALEVRRMRRGRVLRDVSLSIGRGEIVGLAGLVGSGRSELARGIFGVDRVEVERVAVGGVEREIRSPGDAMRAGLAFVPESRRDDGLFMELSVSANVTFGSLGRFASRVGVLKRAAERSVVRKSMGDLAIVAKTPATRVGALSGGNQQKVLFAKWLLRKPDVLILDEPTRGVDVSARAAIHRLISGLAAEGVGILLISSEFEEVLALSHRVLVMREGRIVRELSGEAELAEVMEAAFGMAGSARSVP